jgi:hypothetical protein
LNKLKHAYSKCNQYAERDIEQLDNYYMVHIDAMTVESLRSKSDIAAELAFRDECIAELEKGYEELRMAALNAVCKIGGGQAKADLRDAYDKATEQLEALKEKG